MSLAKDLEIYKAADSLLAFALKFQLQVPRAYRVAVGQRISEQSVEILLLVARANAARGEAREFHIAKLLEQLEAITALLRAAHSSYQRAQNNTVQRLISTKAWAESIELTDSIAKQAHGWLKSARNAIASSTPTQATAAHTGVEPMGDLFSTLSAAPAA
jgi:hypothetical protein